MQDAPNYVDFCGFPGALAAWTLPKALLCLLS